MEVFCIIVGPDVNKWYLWQCPNVRLNQSVNSEIRYIRATLQSLSIYSECIRTRFQGRLVHWAVWCHIGLWDFLPKKPHAWFEGCVGVNNPGIRCHMGVDIVVVLYQSARHQLQQRYWYVSRLIYFSYGIKRPREFK